MKVVIVIPTYNERENIESLIPTLASSVVRVIKNHNIDVLVVDGNSPDGTSDCIKKLSEEYSFLHLLTEKEKKGIGAAYINGFKYAMENMGADIIVEMDGDHQHKPEDLVPMLKAFDEGYDYVIGSRYVAGGSIPKEWAFYRKFLSIGGNLFTKLMLGIFNVHDFTTGYKISRVKDFVDKIDLDTVNSNSFAYKMDLLFRMHKLGARIIEVPITFGLRDRGDSKIERDTMFDSLRVVLLLRLNESKNFIRFFITGLVGLFVDTGLFTALRYFQLVSSLSSAISGFIAMTTTYTINNLWSFNDRKLNGLKKNLVSFLVYFGFSYVPIAFRSWLIAFSIRQYGDTPLVAYSAFSIGVLLGLIWNYTVYSRVIWKKS